MSPQLDVHNRRVRRGSGDADPPEVVVVGDLCDRQIMASGRTEAFEHGRHSGLLWLAKIGVAAQILSVDPVGEVVLDRSHRRRGIETAVVNAVGRYDDVGGESITANVRAFPHELRPALIQRTSNRPSA